MSKKKIFPIIILTITFLLICGYIAHKNKKELYIQTQEKRIDLYFKYNLKDYHSMKVTSFEKTPMDGYFVHGYVNNNKKYYFKITIHPYTNYQY
ncbi:DUF1433 domain-containing protein, partial [Staphylococcus warneri]